MWIHDNTNNVHASGSGRAGGYGYHKTSAAAAEAISNAGIKLETSISGVGDTAICDALCAIAKRLGYRQFIIHESHA